MSDWLSHASLLGHLGKYGQKISDPLAWIGGDKWTHLTSDVLPGKVNEGLSHVMKPFEYVDKSINPVRKIPIVDRVGNIIAAKPGDALAIVAGGEAAAAGMGVGGAGGAGAGAGAAGGGSGYLGEAGLTSAELTDGAGVVGGGGGADAAGLAAADSAAVDAEGAEPGLTAGYGHVSDGASMSNQYQPQQQQQKKRAQLQQLGIVAEPTMDERQRDLEVVTSSVRHKEAAVNADVREIARAGASGQDKISRNGVHIGSLRALDTKLLRLEAQARRKGVKV